MTRWKRGSAGIDFLGARPWGMRGYEISTLSSAQIGIFAAQARSTSAASDCPEREQQVLDGDELHAASGAPLRTPCAD